MWWGCAACAAHVHVCCGALVCGLPTTKHSCRKHSKFPHCGTTGFCLFPFSHCQGIQSNITLHQGLCATTNYGSTKFYMLVIIPPIIAPLQVQPPSAKQSHDLTITCTQGAIETTTLLPKSRPCITALGWRADEFSTHCIDIPSQPTHVLGPSIQLATSHLATSWQPHSPHTTNANVFLTPHIFTLTCHVCMHNGFANRAFDFYPQPNSTETLILLHTVHHWALISRVHNYTVKHENNHNRVSTWFSHPHSQCMP